MLRDNVGDYQIIYVLFMRKNLLSVKLIKCIKYIIKSESPKKGGYEMNY